MCEVHLDRATVHLHGAGLWNDSSGLSNSAFRRPPVLHPVRCRALNFSLSCSASASGDRKPGQPAKTSTQLEARHKAQQRILLPFTRTDLVDSIPLLSSLHHPVVSVHFPPPIALLFFE